MRGKRKQRRPRKKQVEEETEKIEEGCPESSKVQRRSASNCRRNGVNSAISAKVTTPDKNRITTT